MMENQPAANPAPESHDQLTPVESISQPPSSNQSNSKPLLVLTSIILLLIAAVGYLFYQNQQIFSQYQQLRETQTNTPTPTPTPTTNEQTNWKTYTDAEKGYQFDYPATWQVLDSVPEEFMANFDLVNEGFEYLNTPEGEVEWLSQKMFIGDCRGPILQNTEKPAELIAFEIIGAQEDGLFCWSSGYFEKNNRWKVHESYAYPMGAPADQQTTKFPEWRGDYVVFEHLGKNEDWSAPAVLANIGTFELSGQEEFEQMLGSFNFLENNN